MTYRPRPQPRRRMLPALLLPEGGTAREPAPSPALPVDSRVVNLLHRVGLTDLTDEEVRRYERLFDPRAQEPTP